jgi:hypothetical protein
MNENPITVDTAPDNTCYPPTAQALVNLVAEYSRVEIAGIPVEYSISDEALPAEASSQLWFQTTGEGLPKVARLYRNGQWLEFAQLSQGDMVLVASTSTIVSPWGENGFTYAFGDTGLPTYAPPVSPTPPEGLKYKRYVGYWSSKS